MIVYLLAVAILLLTVAVIALFAMLGELYAATERDGEPEEWALELRSWSPPDAAPSYPAPLAALAEERTSALIVLSTSCNTCSHLARGGFEPLAELGVPIGVVISTSTDDGAEGLIEAHTSLQDVPYYVDQEGAWTRTSLGIDTSPTAVLLDHGKPSRAWSLSSSRELARELLGHTSAHIDQFEDDPT